MAEEKSGKKVIAQNREARHEYFVIEALETGIELVGTEVKSLRAGGVNLKDAWADIDDGELIVKGMHISPYEQGNIFNKDRAVPGDCWPIKRRSGAWGSKSNCRGTPWSRFPCISSMAGSSWNWACARAKNSMTNARRLRRAMPSGILTAH